MATIDHLILNVNEIASSVEFYVNVLGFKLEGEDACAPSISYDFP